MPWCINRFHVDKFEEFESLGACQRKMSGIPHSGTLSANWCTLCIDLYKHFQRNSHSRSHEEAQHRPIHTSVTDHSHKTISLHSFITSFLYLWTFVYNIFSSRICHFESTVVSRRCNRPPEGRENHMDEQRMTPQDLWIWVHQLSLRNDCEVFVRMKGKQESSCADIRVVSPLCMTEDRLRARTNLLVMW